MKIDTTDKVILAAQRLVTLREPTQGYGDVANTLIDYLRGELAEPNALGILKYLEDVYAQDRAKTSKTADLIKEMVNKERQRHSGGGYLDR